MFRFQKTDTEATGEMLSSKGKDTILACISAGVLPEILQRGDVGLEVVKRREQGSSLYLDKETGELVSYAEMKAQGGLGTAPVEAKRDPPLQPYFERDIEKDIAICLMGQALSYGRSRTAERQKGSLRPQVSQAFSLPEMPQPRKAFMKKPRKTGSSGRRAAGSK